MNNSSLENYHRYDIKLKNKAIDFQSIHMNGRRTSRFEEPDNHSKLSKLYVVKSSSEIVYIGQTTRNMRRRLSDGLQSEYPYKRKDLPEVCIMIWCFDGKNATYVETIEGEVVFLLRTRTRKWPKYQMEIHFHNAESDEIEVAEAIFRRAIEQS